MATSNARSFTSFSDHIQDAVKQYMAKTHAPGVCVSVIDLNSQELENGYIYPAGFQNLVDGQRVTEETVFQIGSVTKVFTSLLTAYAAVQGKIQPSDKAIKYLHQYPAVKGDSDFDQIALVDLATHTSGMPENGEGMQGVSKQLFDSEPPSQRLCDYWNEYSGAAKLPSCWLYSDIGFVTLGFAIAGMFDPGSPGKNDYGDLLKSLVTAPLEMDNTSAHPAGNLASGYSYSNGANHPVPGVAYDLKSTGTDMLKFLKANLKVPGVKVPAELAKAIDLTQTAQGNYPICNNSNINDASMQMGLGWQMPQMGEGPIKTQGYYKNGATSLGGESCVIEFVPEDGLGIAVLTNQCPNDEVKGGPSLLAKAIRNAITNQPASGATKKRL